jgi:hypothetical protein
MNTDKVNTNGNLTITNSNFLQKNNTFNIQNLSSNNLLQTQTITNNTTDINVPRAMGQE